MDNDLIIKRSFAGLGLKSIYHLSDFAGYNTSYVSSRNGTYEVLYLLIGNKKVITLSAFYHKNYKELKSALMRKNIKGLGVIQWDLMTEIREIFVW